MQAANVVENESDAIIRMVSRESSFTIGTDKFEAAKNHAAQRMKEREVGLNEF